MYIYLIPLLFNNLLKTFIYNTVNNNAYNALCYMKLTLYVKNINLSTLYKSPDNFVQRCVQQRKSSQKFGLQK